MSQLATPALATAGRPKLRVLGTAISLLEELRSGGSFWQRANSIAVRNTTMDEHNYLVRSWMQFVGR